MIKIDAVLQTLQWFSERRCLEDIVLISFLLRKKKPADHFRRFR